MDGHLPDTSKDARRRPINPDSLPDDLTALKGMIQVLLEDVRDKDRTILNLKCQLEALRRRIFGRRSETVDPKQMLLFEELSQQLQAAEEQAANTASERQADAKAEGQPRPKKTNGHGRRPLPADLPRERIVHNPPESDRICPCCGKKMRVIGEAVTEELDYVPACPVVRQHVRPKYACKTCADGVVIADLPPRPIPKGIPGPGLLAHVLTSKYADHTPLHRQQGILGRHDVQISGSTMCDWVREMADLLSPIVVELKQQVLQAHRINTDDTPVLVQGSSGEPTRRGYVWVYIGDGAQVVFDFTETRSRDGPLAVLGGYSGYVQADAFKGYDVLFAPSADGRPSPRTEVGCWAHTRRKFYDARSQDELRCMEMLALVRGLYAVEREAKERQLGPDAVLALRQKRSAALIARIQSRLEAWSIEVLPRSAVGEAVHYARAQWTALTRLLEDPCLPLDNNIAERLLRMVAVGRKNWIFFGSDAGGHRAAVIYSLVGSCKLCGVDPFAYLRDVIARACVPSFDRFADLVPARWKAARQATAQV